MPLEQVDNPDIPMAVVAKWKVNELEGVPALTKLSFKY